MSGIFLTVDFFPVSANRHSFSTRTGDSAWRIVGVQSILEEVMKERRHSKVTYLHTFITGVTAGVTSGVAAGVLGQWQGVVEICSCRDCSPPCWELWSTLAPQHCPS